MSTKGEAPAPLWKATVEDYPRALAWSPTGDRLAVGLASGTITLLHGAEGHVVRQIPAHRGGVVSLGYDEETGVLASGGEDGAVRLWRSGGEEPIEVLPPGPTWAGPLAFSPSGARLAASAGREVTVATVAGAATARGMFPDSTVAALGWTPDGSTLAVAGYGGVHLLDPATGKSRQTLRWKGSMLSLAVSPDGRVVACGCQDNSLHFWRLPEGKDSQMWGYPLKPVAISWSHDGQLLASSGGSVVTVWPFDGPGPEGRKPIELDGHDDALTAVTFAPVVSVLATGCKRGRVCLWTPAELQRPVRVMTMEDRIESLVWGLAPRQQQMLLAGADASGGITVWPFL